MSSIFIRQITLFSWFSRKHYSIEKFYAFVHRAYLRDLSNEPSFFRICHHYSSTPFFGDTARSRGTLLVLARQCCESAEKRENRFTTHTVPTSPLNSVMISEFGLIFYYLFLFSTLFLRSFRRVFCCVVRIRTEIQQHFHIEELRNQFYRSICRSYIRANHVPIRSV